MAQNIAKMAKEVFSGMSGTAGGQGGGAGLKEGSNGKKGLLSDEPFAQGMMTSSQQQGTRGKAFERGFAGETSGMGAYKDYSDMGLKSQFDPMMGMNILNQMRYQPQQRRQIAPIWSKKPWEM